MNPRYFDLHRHLEGSISPFVCHRLGIKQLPSWNPGEDFFSIWPSIISAIDSPNLVGKVAYFALEEISLNCEAYIEFQISPAEYQSDEKLLVTEARAGMERAKADFGVHSALIYNLTRHFPGTIEREIEIAAELFSDGIIDGIGLAGDEINFPLKNLKPLLGRLLHYSIPFSAHAGEFGDSNEIWQAIDMGACRIGHGLSAIKDQHLLTYLANNAIGLEICPTSEILLGNVANLDSHPIIDFMDAGIICNINTDDPAVFSTDIMREYDIFSDRVDLNMINQNAQRMMFNSS